MRNPFRRSEERSDGSREPWRGRGRGGEWKAAVIVGSIVAVVIGGFTEVAREQARSQLTSQTTATQQCFALWAQQSTTRTKILNGLANQRLNAEHDYLAIRGAADSSITVLLSLTATTPPAVVASDVAHARALGEQADEAFVLYTDAYNTYAKAAHDHPPPPDPVFTCTHVHPTPSPSS